MSLNRLKVNDLGISLFLKPSSCSLRDQTTQRGEAPQEALTASITTIETVLLITTGSGGLGS